MEIAQLKVELREGSGKGAARKLRARNKVPGVFYGPGAESVKVAVDPNDIRTAVRIHEGSMPVFTVIPGSKDAEILKGSLVLVRELQTDPLTHEYLHIDLMKIDLTKQITVEVPLHFIGKARGIKNGGIVDEPVRKLEVKCLPMEIPEFIEVDISNLDIGESIHLSEVQVPKGSSVDMTVDFTLVSVILPKRVIEAEIEVEAEAAPEAEEKEETPTSE